MFETLIEAIAGIRERKTEYAEELSKSESLTRYVLVDPLLRALGWDTADPAQVKTEYSLGKWKADYVLMGETDSQPVAVIEAKKLNHDLEESTTLQVIQYAMLGGIPYALLTDGSAWQLFDVFKGLPFPQNRLLDLRLDTESVARCCLSLLLLWRPNLSVPPTVEAKKPLFASFDDSADEAGEEARRDPIQPLPAGISGKAVASAPVEEARRDPIQPLPEGSWISLKELTDTLGRKRPAAVRFADGTKFSVLHWYELVLHTATWLCDRGFLKTAPVSSSRKRYIINDQPVHPNEKNFVRPRNVSHTHWVETNISSWTAVKNSIVLLEHCNEDPQKAMVKMQ